MKIYKDSSNSYPSMVVHPLLLDYSILDYASNNPLFWKLYIVLVLNLLFKLLLLKRLICGNDYLTFCKNTENKGNHDET